jgi:hypothetical protein
MNQVSHGRPADITLRRTKFGGHGDLAAGICALMMMMMMMMMMMIIIIIIMTTPNVISTVSWVDSSF